MLTAILEWQNELSLACYPLSKDVGLKNILVNARFQQFDNFVPTLVSINVSLNTSVWNILTDEGIIAVTVLNDIAAGTSISILGNQARHIGFVTIGAGLLSFITKYLNQTLKINTVFSASCVTSIPTNSGVFSIDKAYGDVLITKEYRIFFEIAGQTMQWNAAGPPNIVTTSSNPLKRINGVGPINNEVHMEDSEIIKIDPINGGLNLSLASSVLNNTIISTIIQP